MNAQLTPTANSPCSHTAREARSSPEASGFQSLFATASQDLPEADAGRHAQLTAEGGSAQAELAGTGKKATATRKFSDDSGAVLNALAAALGQPPSPVPRQDPLTTDSDAGELDSAISVDSGEGAGLMPVTNLEFSGPSFSLPTTTAPAVPGPRPDLQALSLASGASVPEGAIPPGAKAAEPALARGPAIEAQAPDVADTEVGDKVQPSAMQTTRVEGHNSSAATPPRKADSPGPVDTGPGKTPLDVTEGGDGPNAPEGSSSAASTQTIGTVNLEAAAVVDPTAIEAAIVSPPASQKTGQKALSKPGEAPTATIVDGSDAARPPVSAFVVPAATDGSPREKRASSFAKPEESVPDVDNLPSTPLSPSSIQAHAAAMAAGQGIGASTPHSTSPPPPPTPPGVRTPTSSDATPTPVPPALQTAQVLQHMDKAEIRIGLQSTNFGAIRLHTTVANDQVGAAVSTSHPGLRDALLVEAPSLEKAIARHSLRLDSVSVDAGSTHSNFNSFGSNERQPSRQEALSATALPSVPRQQTQPAPPGKAEGSYRLDVRA